MDRLVIFAIDLIPGNAFFRVESNGQIAHDIFDKLRILKRTFSDPFFVGTFEYSKHLRARTLFDDFEQILNPHVLALGESHFDFHFAALVVRTVFGNLFGTGTETGRGHFDTHDKIIMRIARGFEGDFDIEFAGLPTDGRFFVNEIRKLQFQMRLFSFQTFLDVMADVHDLVGLNGLVMAIEHFQKARHMRAFLVVGQSDVHVDASDGVLFAAGFGTLQHNRIANVFDADFIDGNVSNVSRALHIGHGTPVRRGISGSGRGGHVARPFVGNPVQLCWRRRIVEQLVVFCMSELGILGQADVCGNGRMDVERMGVWGDGGEIEVSGGKRGMAGDGGGGVGKIGEMRRNTGFGTPEQCGVASEIKVSENQAGGRD